jgi:hypothetical protein
MPLDNFDPDTGEVFEDWVATAPDDFITVLTALDGGVLAKRHYADGTSLDADTAKWFSSREVPVASLRDLIKVIEPLSSDPHSCIVPGKLAPGIDPARHLRRKVATAAEPATLEPAARHWLPIDYEDKTVVGTDWLDNINETLATLHLPPELLDAERYVHLSGSAGIKEGVRLRLYYWCDKPITDDQTKAWLGAVDEKGKLLYPAIDTSIYSPEHYIYTSRPGFEDGRPDPITGERQWFVKGTRDHVRVPENMPPPKVASAIVADQDCVYTGPVSDIANALDKLPNNDLAWKQWNDIGLAIFAATGGSGEGQELFDKWSAKSSKHGAKESTEQTWTRWTGCPPKATGVRKLFKMVYGVGRPPIEYGYKPAGPGIEEAKQDDTKPKTDPDNPFAAWGSPADFANRPDPVFWDPKTKMLPRDDAEGTTVFVYGIQGAHKTNVLLTWMMDVTAAGAHVLYAAGEGVTGVTKHRIPAHCKARGITLESLTGKVAILPCVPLLQKPDQVKQFIAGIRGFNPNIVVIDTLATATAGMDENSSIFGSLLTANGAVGLIRRAFKATVIILAHEGKDEARGLRGHSGLSGNVDAMLRVKTQRKHFTTVTVTKMRDGETEGNHYYLTEPGTVPVPKPVDAKVFAEALKSAPVVQTLNELRLQGVVIDLAIKYATQVVVPVGNGSTSGLGKPIKLTMPTKNGAFRKLAKDVGKEFIAAVSHEMGMDVPEARVVETLTQSERELYLAYHHRDHNSRKLAGYYPGMQKWEPLEDIEEAAE